MAVHSARDAGAADVTAAGGGVHVALDGVQLDAARTGRCMRLRADVGDFQAAGACRGFERPAGAVHRLAPRTSRFTATPGPLQPLQAPAADPESTHLKSTHTLLS